MGQEWLPYYLRWDALRAIDCNKASCAPDRLSMGMVDALVKGPGMGGQDSWLDDMSGFGTGVEEV